MLKSRHLAFALLATTQIGYAQQIPSAGTQLQQLPQTPAPEKVEPDLVRHPASASPVAPGGVAVPVQTLSVTGQTLFPEAELIATSGFTPGATLTFAQLRDLATRISQYYHARGYFLAQAYLPEQDVQDDTLTITVLEGQYGRISLNNGARLADYVPQGIIKGLKPSDLVSNAKLERRLLLLSDIPGVKTSATLAPGDALGTSDLVIDLTPGKLISGNLEADNAGSRYTGEYRFGGTIGVNNPAGIGDMLSLRVLASDAGLAYGRASYQAPIGPLTFGVAYAHLRYSLGREFDALDGSGTADIFSAYASYPLIRSRRANLYGLASFDYKMLRDDIDLFASQSDKRIKAGTFGLAGDFLDGIGGSTVYSASWTTGHLDIRSAPERIADALTARTAGKFNKVQGSLARAQQIAGPFSLYGAVRGQYALDNLDSSEKMQLGGAYGVRAYPEGEAFGDSGYVATAEARLNLGGQRDKLPGNFELSAFVDTGKVRYAKDPWFIGPNSAARSGYGAGISWTGPHGLMLKGSYARKLGTGPAISAPDRDGRFWVQIVKTF